MVAKYSPPSAAAFIQGAAPEPKRQRTVPFQLRMTEADREALKDLATGRESMHDIALAAVLAEIERRRG